MATRIIPLGNINQAPSNKHPTHHWYAVDIHLKGEDATIVLTESIAGGHAEQGGSLTCSLEELKELDDWEAHFTLAGVEWAIPLIKQEEVEAKVIIKQLIKKAIQT